ncbi:MAG: hypothetical protein L0220_12775 [Acidobacteria bacterium]|nr:hypothetical protein [Acidobacteriota bacterium]
MITSESALIPAWQHLRFRLLGLLPLAFFLSRVIEYVRVGTPEHILWSCHISNLLLAIGIFLAHPIMIRIASYWLILGVLPWIADMVASGLITPVSIFSHLGGFVMGVIALQRVRVKVWSWAWALSYFLVLQQISRLITPPENIYMNVNVAHFAYGPFKDWFISYWKYLVVNTILTAAVLWALELVMIRIFPIKNRFRDMRQQSFQPTVLPPER